MLSAVQAQFSVSGNYIKYDGDNVTIFLFNGITAANTITCTNETSTTFRWYRYTTNPASTDEVLSENGTSSTLSGFDEDLGADNSIGYRVQFGGQTQYIWLIDLQGLSSIQSVVAEDGDSPCEETKVIVSLSNPELYYYSPSGRRSIPREYTLSYNNLEWNEAEFVPKQETVTETIPGNATTYEFTVAAPLCNTAFTLEDNFLKELNASNFSFSSLEYLTKAVEAHPMGKVIARDADNERDKTSGAIGGSAPLVVELTSNANPAATFFEWYIHIANDSTNSRYYPDRDFVYTFQSAEKYTAKLHVSNGTCRAQDSLLIEVLESELEVPNVFTPNGDGINDEFRVAYKSIVKFHAIVFNRWGRKVYEWSDPARGWNGRIAGRLATPGAYYYIIEATGADGVKYKRRGDINLIRGK
jgi:gliding motility-associated-like protein